MTIELQLIGSVRFKSENAFAVDETAFLGNFQYLPIREDSFSITLDEPPIDPGFMLQSRADGRKQVFGPLKATCTFTLNLAPTGVPAGSGSVAQQGPLGAILKAVMGGEYLATGSAFTGAGTALSPVVQSIAGFTSGSQIGWINSSGIMETRTVKALATGSIDLDYAFSGTPANADVCYGAATYFTTEDPLETLQFVVAGSESDDRWVLLGGQCTSFAQAVDVTGAALPAVTITITFADWKDSSEAAGSITGGLADAEYLLTSPIVGFEGEFRVNTIGSTSFSASDLVHVSALDISPKVMFVPVTSPNGKNTIYRWRGDKLTPPVEGSFTTFFEDLKWFNARKNKTDLSLSYQMGTEPGFTVVQSIPTIQIINPQRAAQGSIAGQTVAYQARRNINTSSSAVLPKAAFKLHLM